MRATKSEQNVLQLAAGIVAAELEDLPPRIYIAAMRQLVVCLTERMGHPEKCDHDDVGECVSDLILNKWEIP